MTPVDVSACTSPAFNFLPDLRADSIARSDDIPHSAVTGLLRRRTGGIVHHSLAEDTVTPMTTVSPGSGNYKTCFHPAEPCGNRESEFVLCAEKKAEQLDRIVHDFDK